jgi:hypothetical protein
MAIKSILISLLASSLPFSLAAPTAGDFRPSVRSLNDASPGNLFTTRSETCPGTSTVAPQFFHGPFGNFPAISQWVDFNTMVVTCILSDPPKQENANANFIFQFNNNKQTMLNAGSTNDDVGRIAVAIEDAARNIGIDERVILGIMYVTFLPKSFNQKFFSRY